MPVMHEGDVQTMFSCRKETNTFTDNYLSSKNICSQIGELQFVDGYANDKYEENMRKKSISEVIAIIDSKLCEDGTMPNDVLLNMYNKYQLNQFFNNLNNIICVLSTGGKNRRIKRKSKKKYQNKDIKTKKYKIHSKLR